MDVDFMNVDYTLSIEELKEVMTNALDAVNLSTIVKDNLIYNSVHHSNNDTNVPDVAQYLGDIEKCLIHYAHNIIYDFRISYTVKEFNDNDKIKDAILHSITLEVIELLKEGCLKFVYCTDEESIKNQLDFLEAVKLISNSDASIFCYVDGSKYLLMN